MKFEQPIFVKSAQISAHLYFATQIAKQISLASKNARAITVRAGTKAAGFTAITHFIEELSKETIARANRINKIGVKISRIATEQVKAETTLRDFLYIEKKSCDAQFIDSISGVKKATIKLTENFDNEFKSLLENLTNELDESKKQIRTATVLVSTSKIEATQSGEFEQQFQVIAENLETASSEIKNQIIAASKILDQAKSQRNESHKNCRNI